MKEPARRSNAPPSTTEVGRNGEAAALRHLESLGWRLLAQNYRAGPKEIDLVVEKDGVVAFVEVKTRWTSSGGHAFEAIGAKKRAAVAKAARQWIHQHGRPGLVYRFDAVAVDRSVSPPALAHLPDAWRLG